MTLTFYPRSKFPRSKPGFLYGLQLGIGLLQRKLDQLSPASETPECRLAFTKIEELVKVLANKRGVEAVRAIAHTPGDLHEITFEVLSYVDPPDRRMLFADAVSLVRETEWMLCDAINDQDWDFGTQMVRKFPPNIKEGQVVVCSDAYAQCL